MLKVHLYLLLSYLTCRSDPTLQWKSCALEVWFLSIPCCFETAGQLYWSKVKRHHVECGSVQYCTAVILCCPQTDLPNNKICHRIHLFVQLWAWGEPIGLRQNMHQHSSRDFEVGCFRNKSEEGSVHIWWTFNEKFDQERKRLTFIRIYEKMQILTG